MAGEKSRTSEVQELEKAGLERWVTSSQCHLRGVVEKAADMRNSVGQLSGYPAANDGGRLAPGSTQQNEQGP